MKLAEMIKQHERSSFFGSDAGKAERAAWRGIVRKATAILKAHAGTSHAIDPASLRSGQPEVQRP